MACACMGRPALIRFLGIGILALVGWTALYCHLEMFSSWFSHEVLGLPRESSLGKAVHFFFYDTPKILMLLAGMVYCISWLRAGLQAERIRDYLSNKGRSMGYVLAAIFGAITPFCSCSSIPLFVGFIAARIPLGITMAFLITSPLINEIAVVLLWGLLGWKLTILYVGIGLLLGILGGIFMDAIGAERWLQQFLRDASQTTMSAAFEQGQRGLMERHAFAATEVGTLFRRLWIWVIVGVGLGAAVHGYVPETWLLENLGAGKFWSVPLSVTIGIPLYTNVTGIIPILESLLLKGFPLGTALAFCMSTVAISLPEILLLRQVMRWKLLAVFSGLLLVLCTLIGWLLNTVSPQL